MSTEGPLILFALFMVRLAIPLLILLALGTIYENLSRRGKGGSPNRKPAPGIEMRPVMPVQRIEERIAASTALEQPCWAIKNCSAEARAECPALQREGVPCWLTFELAEGRLPERCIDCQVFKDSAPHHLEVA